MVDIEITPEDFIKRLKEMTPAERKRITLKRLIEVILEVPEPTERSMVVDIQIEQLRTMMTNVTDIANQNRREIDALRVENNELRTTGATQAREIGRLKEEIEEMKNENENEQGNDIANKIEGLQDQIDEIEQYLRANNVEIVGLPAPNTGESEETLIVNAINSLVGLPAPVAPEDIDISHSLPSRRRDNKPVHVVRFVHRKNKFAILTAKRAEANRQFKFRNNDVYINEHLNKPNRTLFATANEKKGTLGYKYVWTKGGVVNMRKDEHSEVITIKKAKDFEKLQ